MTAEYIFVASFKSSKKRVAILLNSSLFVSRRYKFGWLVGWFCLFVCLFVLVCVVLFCVLFLCSFVCTVAVVLGFFVVVCLLFFGGVGGGGGVLSFLSFFLSFFATNFCFGSRSLQNDRQSQTLFPSFPITLSSAVSVELTGVKFDEEADLLGNEKQAGKTEKKQQL